MKTLESFVFRPVSLLSSGRNSTDAKTIVAGFSFSSFLSLSCSQISPIQNYRTGEKQNIHRRIFEEWQGIFSLISIYLFLRLYQRLRERIKIFIAVLFLRETDISRFWWTSRQLKSVTWNAKKLWLLVRIERLKIRMLERLVLLVGNGPSAIVLSYLLSGHVPYWNGCPVSNDYLNMKLEEHVKDVSLLEQVRSRE